ncbi:MAG: polysulfide reductase NrfD [Deltaproteobacteria bacterium]|nr:polysulfide reductase NrfD [Deltaproteobacteria bacterium]
MIEKAFVGNRNYWVWIFFLLILITVGFVSYMIQLDIGLSVTGMSRDVTWGVYIAQFTFLVGVAASAVMLVIPYYLHNYKKFGKIVILGEFLAVSAVLMCMLFVFVDMGKPMRVLNVILYPTPNSILFWDMTVLSGYLVLNVLCGWVVLSAEHKGVQPPKWIKPFIYLSIPWAVSIHTVTAFLYAGLPGRHLWLTAILAPRFLASAFAAGPALLVLLSLLLKKLVGFDAGKEAIEKLTTIILYAAIINFFFVAMEFFTAFYSNIPGHEHGLAYLFFGLEGHHNLVPWMWFSLIIGIGSVVIFLIPKLRQNQSLLIVACLSIFLSLWIDKGIGLVLGGFVPSPLESVTEYSPSLIEILITLGIWAIGAFVLTVLYKIAISVKNQNT